MGKQLKERVVGNPVSSIVGVVLGAAVTGAVSYFQASGGSLDWRGYAVAGGMGATTALTGLLYKKKKRGDDNGE